MLRTFFVIAYRNIIKNRVFSTITVLGLTLGIAICLSIAVIVHYELSFNKGFENFNQIYRIHTSFSGVFSATNPGVPVPVGEFAKDNLTGYDHITSFFSKEFNVTINNSTYPEKKIKKNERIILAEPSYFEVFPDYAWLAGNSTTAL